MKKKVMHIVQSPGGVERYILMLLKNMDLSKYDNILVCSFDYDEEKFKDIVVAFEQVDMVREISLKKDISSIINVRRIIKKYNPDVVYMHSSKAGAIGRVANIGLKNKSIYNPHGWAFNIQCSNLKKNIYRYIEKILSHLCTYIIAISDFERESAIKNKICKSDKVRVIYNAIDINEYEEKKKNFTLTRKELNIPENSYIIGIVGRLTKQKAPDIFIKVAKKIKIKYPNSYFIMVGDGELRENIEKLIKENNLDRSILITGWVDEPMEYIELFDQAMLLSRWEGFGLVLAEYMLARKPIIATEVDAIPNLINNNENGILVNMDAIDEIVIASEYLINNSEEVDLIVNRAENIVRNNFNITRLIKEFEELCE